ncbi:MAG: lysophospholipase [Nitratireductor sp.]|nr:lysophospholipase [Nitratireductor sp.]
MFSPSPLSSPTGATLAIRLSPATGNAKGIVQINHGMAEHCGRYARFAAALNARGWHAIAHDHRGHGQTTAPDAPQGVFAASNGHDKVLEDCRAVNHHARKIWPNLPLVLFGHSMGSIIGLNYCIRHSDTIDGAVLWNSGADAGMLLSILVALLKIERMFKGSDVPSAIAAKLTFEAWNKAFAPNRTAFDWLSRDEAEVDRYVADPQCGFPCSSGLWLDLTQMIAAGASDRELARIRRDLPIYLLGGEADPCSDHGKAMLRLADRLRLIGATDLTVRTLPDTRHETLNEINRDEETALLCHWLEARFEK